MEAEGITRACTMVPVIKKKASATHTHESSSRTRRWRKVLVSTLGERLGAPARAESGAAEGLVPASGLMESALVKLSLTELSLCMALCMAFFRAFPFGNGHRFAGNGRHADFELNVFGDVVAC